MDVRRSDLDDVFSILNSTNTLGLDSETTGLRWSDRLFNLIISNANTEYVFWFSNSTAPEEYILNREEFFTKFRVLAARIEKWYIQNAKFDLRMLHHEDIHILGEVVCTYALGRVYKNNRFGKDPYSLASQSHDYLGKEKDDSVKKYIEKNRLKTFISIPGKGKRYEVHHYDRVPFDVMRGYSATDGRLHYDLGVFLEDNIPDDMQALVKNENQFVKTCLDMEIRGIKVNKDYTNSAFNYEEGLLRESMSSFRALTGYEYDNKKSTLLEIFRKEGVQIPLTEAGNPSLTDDVLEEIDSPAAESVRKIRGHEKKIATYYSNFLFFADSNDIIHADFRQGGTETGRLSCRDPNLQNLPAEDEEEDRTKPFLVRGCFTPRPGKMYSSVDFKQQEFRMLADYAGEMALIRAIMSGADVHQATADLVGITRKQAKTLNFALIYGMGIAKLAKALGISLHEAKTLRLKYFARFPHIEDLLRRVAARGEKNGYIKTWLGRRQHLFSPEYSYILPNHLIQGGCGDVMKTAMNRIFELPNYNLTPMVSTIHDEIIFEHDPEHLDLIKPIRKIMESVYPNLNGMILETDHSISYTTLAKLEMEKT